MTIPASTSNIDAPVASVSGKYISEVTSVVALIAALLGIFFGKDFGVTRHVQDLLPLVLAVVPASMSISRAFKHSSAVLANARVYTAQMAAAAVESPAVAAPDPTDDRWGPVEAVPAPADTPIDTPGDSFPNNGGTSLP